MILALSSCKGTTGPAAATITPDERVFGHVYRETRLPVPTDGRERDISDLAVAGDRFYWIEREDVTAEDEESEYRIGQRAVIKSADTDGGDVRAHVERESVSDGKSHEGVVRYSTIERFAVDTDGNLWTLEQSTFWDNTDADFPIYEQELALVKYSPGGERILDADIAASYDEGELWSQDALCDGAGNVYTRGHGGIAVFDGSTGAFLFAATESDYITGAARAPGGEIYYATDAQKGFKVNKIDVAAKSAVPLGAYEGGGFFYEMSDGAGKYAFFYKYMDCIYGFDVENMTAEVVVSFQNSDLEAAYYLDFAALDGGDFVAYVRLPDGAYFARLSEDADAAADKAVITLGVWYATTELKRAVMEFNRESADARISITDYSEYDMQGGSGTAQLDLDIIAGRAPDIVDVGRLSAGKYASKGVFEDLYPYLDGDAGIDRADMFPNVLAMTDTGGRLYHMMTSFGVISFEGKASIFGDVDSITTGKLAAVMDAYPGAQLMQDADMRTWFQLGVMIGLEDYIDWNAGTCSFDSAEFIDFLEFCKKLPETAASQYVVESDSALYRENLALLSPVQLNVASAREARERFGEEAAFVGFPTAGACGNVAVPRFDFAISASSKNKQLCWEFISRFLREDYAPEGGDFSLNSRAFERAAAQAIESATADSPLTEGDVARVRAAIEATTRWTAGIEQDTMMGIITEEAEAFFAGINTADRAAEMIQSRVSIYVSENS
ncbi:MAG: hypothetical protein LBN99_08325 [Oscillospiraceae bacterium]|jgi:ABC-type glycerol-3-phosphate transport system substrate-binding protein|nr:hypothetical protein [Oscillospiraceae bacterium]